MFSYFLAIAFIFAAIDDTEDLVEPGAEEELASSESEGNFAVVDCWIISGFFEEGGGGGGGFFLIGDLTDELESLGGKLVLMEAMANFAKGSSRLDALFWTEDEAFW